MVERFARAWRTHVDPEKFSDKEITGKLLSSKVCSQMVDTKTWKDFKSAVQAGELDAAVALLDADTNTSARVARAIMFTCLCPNLSY
eukprot:SAG11_NODE_21525_length_423_cov_2.163580_1_plen_87_part_00